MKAITRAVLPFAFALGLMSVPLNAAWAQSSSGGSPKSAVPEALGPEAMSALVSKLDPEQTAALVKLMELLEASVSGAPKPPSETEPARILDSIQKAFSSLGEAVVSHVTGLPEMLTGIFASVAWAFSGRGLGGGLLFLLMLAVTVALGAAIEWGFDRLYARRRAGHDSTPAGGLLETLKVLSKRALVQFSDLVAFTAAALVAAQLLLPEGKDQAVATSLVLLAILIPRFAAAALRFVLAPRRPDLRLVSTNDRTAVYIYRNLVGLAAAVGIALFIFDLMQRSGTAGGGTFRFWAGAFITGWVIYITWRARDGLTSIIEGDEEHLTPGLKRVAAWWPELSIAIIAFDWFWNQLALSTGDLTLTPGRGALSLALIVVAPFLDTMVRGIAAHLVPAMEGEGAVAEKAYNQTRLSYVRLGRIILITILVVVIAKLRGVSLYRLTEVGLGGEIASSAMGFLLIVAVGYIAWEVTNLVINRKLARELPEPVAENEGGEAGGAGLSRMATVLPILRMTLQATIITLTVLLALGQLGINITPLLAGAGILGLAIGFGAQTLVKDIVSGVFFLLDDAFRLGEYVDVGGTEGTVEKISVRSLQLRGSTGPVHIVPYGSISGLTNMSRDWVIMKLKFRVPFDTDLEKVRKIFKKIGREIMEVPEYAEGILSPFKSQGAADVDDIGIVVRGKFTTKPGAQWAIRKEIYTRVQKAFEENGIEFARKEVRVQLPEHDEAELSPEQRRAVAGAAAQAAEDT